MAETEGRIIRGVGGLYFVDTEKKVIECRARGKFRHGNESPQVGDFVIVETAEQGENVIKEILPRKNLLIRPAMSNLDDLFAVIPSASPSPDLPTVDKLTAIAVHNKISVCCVIGKCRLDEKNTERISEIYKKSGMRLFVTDSVTGDGIDELRDFILARGEKRVAAFAGASGVGKSTLLNALFPDLSLATGSVSERTERGRHTTRKVELFAKGGGYIADTPGFTMLDFKQFDFMSKEDLPYAFPEFLPYLGKCRYRKCTHTKEEGCAILEAIDDGIIAPERHKSYTDLYLILKDKHEWDKKH